MKMCIWFLIFVLAIFDEGMALADSCQVKYVFMLNCFVFESSFPIELELKYVLQ